MHEMKEKVKEICCLKEKMLKLTTCEFESGIQNINAEEMDKAIDWIKDLSEAEKNCYETMYYAEVIKAMKEGSAPDEDGWDERRGYNHRHFMNGRFAPGGEGHSVRGYLPSMNPYMDKYLHDPNFEQEMVGRHGYQGSATGGRSGGSNGSYGGNGNSNMGNMGSSSGGRSGYVDGMMDMYDDRYGRPYHEYRNARRNYTATHSLQDKNEMDNRANEHILTTVETVREIYRGADPELKKKIKEDITKLVSEMNM